jgi:hypothetical protein
LAMPFLATFIPSLRECGENGLKGYGAKVKGLFLRTHVS